MIDPKALLDQFLSSGAPAPRGDAAPAATSPWTNPAGAVSPSLDGIAGAARNVLGQGGAGGLVGAAAAGGLISLFLGKKGRKLGGGLVSHGGAAVLGALADRAFRNWQAGRQPAAAPPLTRADTANVEPRFLPGAAPAAQGEAFELALIRAMIGAARADGHIDAEERRRIFAQVEDAGLDAEAKAFVFDTLDSPVSVSEVAAAATTPEQAAEIYIVSRLAADPDDPAERAYLEALAHRLKLPAELVAHLDRQSDSAATPVA